MVQQVEDLEADLEADPFRDLGGLVQVEIPLDDMRTAEGVAAAGPDGSVGRNGKDRGPIRNSGVVRIANVELPPRLTELVSMQFDQVKLTMEFSPCQLRCR